MSIDTIIMLTAGGIIVVLSGLLVWWHKRPIKLDTSYFGQSWKELQKLCKDTTTWPQAIINADRLLSQALKKKRFGGRNMGAQLVKAQRLLSDNDAVWYSHKLRTKLEADPALKLKQSDVKQALVGTRQALKDLGALE